MNARQLLRYEKGLTLSAVAEGAKVSRPTLESFEKGQHITAPVALKLANFYGVTVAQLFGVDPLPEPNGNGNDDHPAAA